MSRRNRIFAGILLVYVAGIAFLLYRIVLDVDPRYREATEEALVETAQVLASFVEHDVHDGTIDPDALAQTMKAAYARELDAQIFGFVKDRVELRVYVVDRDGRVLYDSTGRTTGQDYSSWRDVSLTLAGFYGARTTPDVAGDPRTAVMYVGAPIHASSETDAPIVGVLTVGKPTQSFGQFVEAARNKIILVGIGSAFAVLLFAFIVSIWLVRPFGLVGDAARAAGHIARDRGAGSFGRLVRRMRRTPRALREAYRDMRDAVSGRSYVEDYVQTLTHELKSPLSAIRGAAELLEEPMPEEQRRRFVANIARETDRIRELADRMLELAVLEQRHRLDDPAAIDAVALGHEVVSTAAGGGRGVQLRFVEPDDRSPGDRRRRVPAATCAREPDRQRDRLLADERRGHGRAVDGRQRARASSIACAITGRRHSRTSRPTRSSRSSSRCSAADPEEEHRPRARVRARDRGAASRQHRARQPSRRRCGRDAGPAASLTSLDRGAIERFTPRSRGLHATGRWLPVRFIVASRRSSTLRSCVARPAWRLDGRTAWRRRSSMSGSGAWPRWPGWRT